jgi:ABC-type lipoprotein release transport system permease subunit
MRIPVSLCVGFFLATRQLRRSNPWSTSLIVFVMILTFLNLVVVSGILVGLIQGSINANRMGYIGDVAVVPIGDKTYIENSAQIAAIARANPAVAKVAGRYVTNGTVESNYKTATNEEDRQRASGQVIGISPSGETADIADYIIEGEMLEDGDYDKVLLGSNMLSRYLNFEVPGFPTLDDVYVGTKVRVKIGGATRDMTVKGIIKRKVDEVDRGVIMLDTQFRDLSGINEYAVISMLLHDGANASRVRDELIVQGAGKYADVNTFDEAIPKPVLDIRDTFAILGNLISLIGLVVAAITVFIVIFINALTRQKFIGILKGIGITGRAIEVSYVFQSMFYACIGSSVGLVLLYTFLVPYMAANPIDFPFSDGILVAEPLETSIRVGVLVGITIVAGYIPAWMIVRRNTLNSILGR